MKNYDEMTWREINLAVAKILHPDQDVSLMSSNDHAWVDRDTVNVRCYDFSFSDYSFDLMTKNKISLDARKSKHERLGWLASFSDEIYHSDKCPKRAIAICFLKMHEKQ